MVEKAKRKLENTQQSTSIKRLRSSRTSVYEPLLHCVYCGETCDINRDPKHPDRWRPAYVRRTCKIDGNDLKTKILEACDLRDDLSSDQVRVRVLAPISDLHAADVRYHNDCRLIFFSRKNITEQDTCQRSSAEIAFSDLVLSMKHSTEKVWTSGSIYEEYVGYLSKTGSRSAGWGKKWLIEKIKMYFGDDLIVLRSVGLQNMFIFKDHAATVLKPMLKDESDNDLDASLQEIGSQIKHELKCTDVNSDRYVLGDVDELVGEEVSTTLVSLLAVVCPKLKGSQVHMINSILLQQFTQAPTALQVFLSVYLRDIPVEKFMSLHRMGVLFSYDELKRFRSSAAHYAASSSLCPTLLLTDGLIQFIIDNFDLSINSPTGVKQTHSLAAIIAKDGDLGDVVPVQVIPRLSLKDSRKKIDYEIEMHRYNGPKKPSHPSFTSSITDSERETTVKLQEMAATRDIEFIKDAVLEEGTPEYNGWNTRFCREYLHLPASPKTSVVFCPLIDKNPAEPDTVKTALKHGQDLAAQAGQDVCVCTSDQAIYKVTQQVKWGSNGEFENVKNRMGGMHLVMSFTGAIATNMKNLGLEPILASVFGGVKKMLTGKNFPNNIRAFFLLAEELLRDVSGIESFESTYELVKVLEESNSESKTALAWIRNFISPIFILMRFIRAEREGEWLLHLATVREMIPHFFAAGHHNYARHATSYVQEMEALPPGPGSIKERFMNKEFTMRLTEGIWNNLYSDQVIETTYMKTGKGPTGLKGNTLDPEIVKR